MKTDFRVVGIDPGESGGFVVLDCNFRGAYKIVGVQKIPLKKEQGIKSTDWNQLADIFTVSTLSGNPVWFYSELITGQTQKFQILKRFCKQLDHLLKDECHVTVPVGTWQKFIGAKVGVYKKDFLNTKLWSTGTVARELHREDCKMFKNKRGNFNHNLCDAFHIAVYGMNQVIEGTQKLEREL